MENKRGIAFLMAVLILLSLSCSLTQSNTPTPEPVQTEAPTKAAPTLRPTATPEPKATPVPRATPEVEGASIAITNASGRDIWYVYLSLSDQEEWGEDLLAGDIIPDGGAYTLTDIAPGVYDVRAEDGDGNVIQTLWEAQVEGAMTWTVEAAAGLTVINNSALTISYLYLSFPESDSWGGDWLNGATIAPGETYFVGDIEPAVYDIRADDADDKVVETVYSVDLLGGNTWTVVGKTDLPPNAVLRFEDDFTNNRNNWGTTSEGPDVKYIPPANGEYCILIKTDSMTAWEWYEPFRTDEFVAEVACKLEESDASCGLGFGPDGDNLYWYEISPFDQTFALFLLLDDAWQTPLIDWTESKSIRPNDWNYLSLERVNKVVSIYVNGVLIGQVNSDHFPTGRIGLGGATYDDPNVTVCLDNLRVWRLE